jgi:hypothetical protein
MLNQETYNYSLNKYITHYPKSDEYEYIIGQIFTLRNFKLSIQFLSEYDLQQKYLSIFKKNKSDYDLDEIIAWGTEYKLQQQNKIDREIKFYEIQLGRINPNTTIKENSQTEPRKLLKWTGTDLELSETLKALIETDKFVGQREKHVFKIIFETLGLKYSDSIKKERLATIKNRTKELTPFIHSMETNLSIWIKEKDDK